MTILIGKKPYFPVLESEISKAGIRKKDIAKRLGITPRSFSQKLAGDVDFWLSEVVTIHSFFPNIEPFDLFKHNIS